MATQKTLLHRWTFLLALGMMALTAGCINAGHIEGVAWLDINGDGIRDENETRIEGIQVILYRFNANDSKPQRVDSTFTDSEGKYAFMDHPLGRYFLDFEPLNDDRAEEDKYDFIMPDQGEDDSIDSDAHPFTGNTELFIFDGETDTAYDVGLQQNRASEPATLIEGTVWNDANGNGEQDAGEEGVEGVRVVIGGWCSWIDTLIEAGIIVGVEPAEEDAAEECDPTDGQMELDSTETDDQGSYHFTNPPPGEYWVRVEIPFGFGSLSPDLELTGSPDLQDGIQGEGNFVDLNPFPLGGGEGPVQVRQDVGLTPVVSIGDQAWIDENGDGIRGDDEEPLPGVEVALYSETVLFDDSLGGFITFVGSTFTDESGMYFFDSVPPGRVVLEFIPPSGYLHTIQDAGDDDGRDSDADRITGETDGVDVSTGDGDFTLDAGFVPLDLSNSIIFPPDEPGFGYVDPAPNEPGPDDNVILQQFNCETGDYVSDPEALLIGAGLVSRPQGEVIYGFYAQMLVTDFSFATVLSLWQGDVNTVSYVYEMHDGQVSMGQLMPDNSLIPADQVDNLGMFHQSSYAYFAFQVPPGQNFDGFTIETYHMGTPTSPRTCSFFDVFSIEMGMQLNSGDTSETNGSGVDGGQGETRSTTTAEFDGTVEGFSFDGTWHQEDGELIIRYRVTQDGTPADGIGRATIAVGNPGGSRAEHGEADIDQDGFVEINLPLDTFEEGEEVDIWIFFDGLSAAVQLGSFIVGQ